MSCAGAVWGQPLHHRCRVAGQEIEIIGVPAHFGMFSGKNLVGLTMSSRFHCLDYMHYDYLAIPSVKNVNNCVDLINGIETFMIILQRKGT